MSTIPLMQNIILINEILYQKTIKIKPSPLPPLMAIFFKNKYKFLLASCTHFPYILRCWFNHYFTQWKNSLYEYLIELVEFTHNIFTCPKISHSRHFTHVHHGEFFGYLEKRSIRYSTRITNLVFFLLTWVMHPFFKILSFL